MYYCSLIIDVLPDFGQLKFLGVFSEEMGHLRLVDRKGILGSAVHAPFAALLLGDFSDCKPTNTARYPYSMEEVVDTLRRMLPFPVLTGLPIGHVARKTTLPFGAPGALTIREGGYSLRFSGHVQR